MLRVQSRGLNIGAGTLDARRAGLPPGRSVMSLAAYAGTSSAASWMAA